jgi:hypothetical protein
VIAPLDWASIAFIAIAGYYMGADLVVNQMTWAFIDAKQVGFAERNRQWRFLLLCDQHPRIGLILFVALSLTIEIQQGLWPLSVDTLPLIWLGAAVWYFCIWMWYWAPQSKADRILTTLDLYWRYLFSFGIAGLSLISLFGDGPMRETWQAVKWLLVSALVGGGLIIRYRIIDVFKLWPDYEKNGSTPAFEAKLGSALAQASYVNWLLWAIFITMTLLTIVQPEF